MLPDPICGLPNPRRWCFCFSHCAAKEAEAQRGLDTCPRSYSNPSFSCLIKPEDVEVSGPLLTVEGLPISSVALPPYPGGPAPVTVIHSVGNVEHSHSVTRSCW